MWSLETIQRMNREAVERSRCCEHPSRPVSAADPDRIRCGECVVREGRSSGFTPSEIAIARAEMRAQGR